jgi:RNA polymerase sigma-70 factor (ECF subfamily)
VTVALRTSSDPPSTGTLLDETFPSFYQREYRPVVGLAYVLTGDRSEAEDLAQDAFAAASRRWDQIGTYDQPRAWVRRVVVNRSVSWRRRRAAEFRALARLGPRRDSSELAVSAETSALWSAVRRLPARQAQTIALVYLADLPVAETARVLGCGTETVKTHLKRARKTLAEQLGGDEEMK